LPFFKDLQRNIRELAEELPELKKILKQIHDSIEDLIVPFHSKAYYERR
jgi:hypothetical protein